MIRRVKLHLGQQPPATGPWIADWRSCDIPETVAGAIRTLADWRGCIGITLRPYGGRRMAELAEKTAEECNLKIFWVRLKKELY